MEEKILGRNGSIYCEFNFSGKYSKLLKNLLIETLSNFSNTCMKYIRDPGFPDFPFTYNELVLQATLTHALFSATKTGLVFTEYPIERNKESSGRVDFFICEKYSNDPSNRCFIYLETKFGWFSYRSIEKKKPIRKDLIEKLEKGVKQIKSISLEKNAAALLLSIFPIYYKFGTQDEKNKKDLEDSAIRKFKQINKKKIKEYAQEIKNYLGKNNFLCIWFIPNLEENYFEYDSKYETYPAIIFSGTYRKP